MYLDANNLYGWAKSQPLSYSNFRWKEEENRPKTIKDWLLNINTKYYGIGKIYEVDLEYPSKLHDLHNDYPCAAEKLNVTDDMLSDYCRKIRRPIQN